jgi:hypothetical protein
MDQLIESLFNDANHLGECQRFVMERVEFLEMKRLEITRMIQNLSDSSYKETLEHQIDKMGMKLSINCVADEVKDKVKVCDKSKPKKHIKCRYNDRGLCRSKFECVYFHSEKICDKALSSGKCLEYKTCFQRHPKDCKHWMGDTRGCLRGSECKYLHNSSKKGNNIKKDKNFHETKSEGQHNTDDGKKIIEKNDDKSLDSLEETVTSKQNEIKDMEDKVQKLISENENLIVENERIKRCARKMDQEIKSLRSQTN